MKQKYQFYIVKNNTIISEGFDNFLDAVNSFFSFVDVDKIKSLAIIKLSKRDNIKEINFSVNATNLNYVFMRMDSGSGHLEGPIENDNLKTVLQKLINTYGHNGCKFLGFVKTNFQETKKLFDIIK